jgi:hypothetical protein
MTDEEKKRRQKKIQSVRTLASNIHKLRNQVTKDLKSDKEKVRLTALAVAIIDKTSERVGNEESAKDGHVGVTGFQNKHVEVEGDTVKLKYTGKSGVEHEKQFTDKLMAKLLKECKGRCDSKDAALLTTSDGFKIKSDKVNRYLRDFDITAKDLRGYSANKLVTQSLTNAQISKDEDERKKKFSEVLKSVAEKVGHQKATLKTHYLLPKIETEYVKKGKVINLKEASTKAIQYRDLSSRRNIYASETYNAPEGASKEAQKALDWKEKYGDEVKGGTAVGWTRANQLAKKENLSKETVERMYKFFQRHEKNKSIDPKFKNEPWKDAGYVAWLIWGGDAGKSWAEKMWKKFNPS